MKAAASGEKMEDYPMPDGADFPSTPTPTAALLDELALTGYVPHSDEHDPRPLPEASACHQALGDIFDAVGWLFDDTRLEDEAGELMWGITNLLHRRINRLDTALDRNEQAQRDSSRVQDGSEIRSVELERLTAEGVSLVERRNAMEFLRDAASNLYARHTGRQWLPAAGSVVNRATQTASMIDARDFMAARKAADTASLAPSGTLIAYIAGPEYKDQTSIIRVLDKARAKHPDMVLVHGGDANASMWAKGCKIPQIVFKPDFTRHGNAAPFKRNDEMLAINPKGLIAGPGRGVRQNLVDKARRAGVSVLEFE